MVYQQLIKSFILVILCLFASSTLFAMQTQNSEVHRERKFSCSSIEYSFIASENQKSVLDCDFNDMIKIFKNSYNKIGLQLGINQNSLNDKAQSIMADFWIIMALDEKGFFIVARQDKQVVGFSYFEKSNDDEEIMLEAVVVKKSHRKHGIGSTLVFAIFDDLPNVEYITADVNSYDWQGWLEKFYKKIHFQEENVCLKLPNRQNPHNCIRKKFLRYRRPEFR